MGRAGRQVKPALAAGIFFQNLAETSLRLACQVPLANQFVNASLGDSGPAASQFVAGHLCKARRAWPVGLGARLLDFTETARTSDKLRQCVSLNTDFRDGDRFPPRRTS